MFIQAKVNHNRMIKTTAYLGRQARHTYVHCLAIIMEETMVYSEVNKEDEHCYPSPLRFHSHRVK